MRRSLAGRSLLTRIRPRVPPSAAGVLHLIMSAQRFQPNAESDAWFKVDVLGMADAEVRGVHPHVRRGGEWGCHTGAWPVCTVFGRAGGGRAVLHPASTAAARPVRASVARVQHMHPVHPLRTGPLTISTMAVRSLTRRISRGGAAAAPALHAHPPLAHRLARSSQRCARACMPMRELWEEMQAAPTEHRRRAPSWTH